MRKLLNTLFVTSEDAYLALENENVVIYKGEEKAAQYPLKLFESLLSFSYKGASPALMGACVRNGIGADIPHAQRANAGAGSRRIAGQCAPAQGAVSRFGQPGSKLSRGAKFHLWKGSQQPLGAGAHAA